MCQEIPLDFMSQFWLWHLYAKRAWMDSLIDGSIRLVHVLWASCELVVSDLEESFVSLHCMVHFTQATHSITVCVLLCVHY